MLKPEISKKAFWDARFSNIDFEKHSLYVMEKVFNYGSWDDQVGILKFYGMDRVRREITNAGYLRKPVISYLSAILDVPKTEFQCYNKMRSHPLPWNY